MREKVLVSVIIAMYNSERFIGRCLESLLKQTYKNMEVLIVDDGSTDQSGVICEKYARQDSRVTYIKQGNNGGVGAARNRGLDNASGDYILFVDSDDWLDLSAVETFLSIAVCENADIVILEAKVQTAEGIQYYPRKDLQNLSSKQLLEALLLDKFGNHVIIKLFNQRLWSNVRFPNLVTYEDLFVMPYVAGAAKKIVYKCVPVYFYNRCNEDSLTWWKNDFNALHRYSKFVAYCEHEKVGVEQGNATVINWSIEKALHESIKVFIIDAGRGGLTDEQRHSMRNYIAVHQEHIKKMKVKDQLLLKSILGNGFLYKVYGNIERVVKG